MPRAQSPDRPVKDSSLQNHNNRTYIILGASITGPTGPTGSAPPGAVTLNSAGNLASNSSIGAAGLEGAATEYNAGFTIPAGISTITSMTVQMNAAQPAGATNGYLFTLRQATGTAPLTFANTALTVLVDNGQSHNSSSTTVAASQYDVFNVRVTNSGASRNNSTAVVTDISL